MAKANSSKNKDQKKKKNTAVKKSDALKSLKSDQKKKPVPVDKSLNSLKKIQTQLDDLLKQRKKEKKLVKALKKNSQTITEQLEAVEARFPKLALNKDLQKTKADLKKKSSQFQQNSDKFSREISLFKDLTNRVEDKILALEKNAVPNSQQLHSLNENQVLLSEKISQFELELNQFSDKFIQPEQTEAGFIEQLNQLSQIVTQINQNHQQQDSQIKLLQTDTGNIRTSLQQLNQDTDNLNQNLLNEITEQSQKTLTSALSLSQESNQKQLAEQALKIEQQFEHQYELLTNKISATEEAQHQLITPLENHLKQLEDSIQSINQDYVKQQILVDDEEKLSELTNRVNQFDTILQQSQNELKQHMQRFRESEQDENSAQLTQFSHKLAQLSQHLDEVAQQSSSLQNLFSELQEQQSSTTEHHDELSKQYLNQQQQLQHHDSQLVHLIPLIEQNNGHDQQLGQLSETVNQLASAQNSLSEIEQKKQSNLTTLAQKLERNHSTHQQHINQLESHQQEQKNQQHEQASTLAQLGEQIKSRSLLFSLGLFSVLALSSLLFFNQDILQNDTEKQVKISQIKAQITNETFTKINALTKQNSSIINEQLSQIRNSIQQVKQNKQQSPVFDSQPLQNDWQNRHQLIVEEVANIQTGQQTLNQSVAKLSTDVSAITEQFQQLDKLVQKKSPSLSDNKVFDLQNVTNIKSLAKSFYAIQLLGVLQKDSIKHFLKHHKLSETTKLYQTELHGKPWYILLYGHYASYSQAREQLQQLPEFLLQAQPWVRKLP